jgi:hypothetical protein
MAERMARRWQFSLLTLLLAMSGVAVLCLALRSPNEIWAALVFLAVLAGLALAALAAIYRDGRTRAFALGFLIVGAGYFGLVLLTESPDVYGQPRLPTTRWATSLCVLLHEGSVQRAPVMTAVDSAPPPPLAAVQATPAMLPPGPPPTPSSPVAVTTYVASAISYSPLGGPPQFALATFLEISHQSLALLLGALGGIVAQLLYATRREAPASAAAA